MSELDNTQTTDDTQQPDETTVESQSKGLGCAAPPAFVGEEQAAPREESATTPGCEDPYAPGAELRDEPPAATEPEDPSPCTAGERESATCDASAPRAVEHVAATPDRDERPEDGTGAGTEDGLGAAGTVSSLFTEGVASMKEVSEAHRVHAEARAGLERLDITIAARERELEHRRDIESRYNEIVIEETSRKRTAEQERDEAHERAADIAAEITSAKKRLEAMRDEDATVERRLKTALEAAEDKERSSRESGRRLQRRLDDAKSNLERTVKEREDGIAAAQQAVKSAETHLATLNAEYAEIQRNPSANSAGYSVRKRELEIEISDATEALRNAKDAVPRVDRETELSVDAAREAVREAERPIAAAIEAFNDVAAAADRARDEHGAAKDAAAKRQKDLRAQISEREKAVRVQERTADEAQKAIEDAQLVLDEANDIHANPDATISLANALEADRAEREERAGEVEDLAAAEKNIRERTRGARLKLSLAIGSIILIVVLMFVWTYFAR